MKTISSTRRDFIKTASVAAAGFTILPSHVAFPKEIDAKVRLGFIGVGFRGQCHLDLALNRTDVEVVAICDVQQRMIDLALEVVRKAGKPKPQVILEGPYGYKKLLENKDIDAVIIATPWEWHTRMCIDAMNAKKYVGCEVITGTTVDECWEIVRASEKT